MSLDEILGIKYKLFQRENFENFLELIGVGIVFHQLSAPVTPVVELNKEGDEYVLSTWSELKNSVIKFKPGVEFDQIGIDGKTVKNTITIDGNTLHEVQKNPISHLELIIDSTWTHHDMTKIMSAEGITATNIYKRVPE